MPARRKANRKKPAQSRRGRSASSAQKTTSALSPAASAKVSSRVLLETDFAERLRSELRRILESLVIESPSVFTLGGRRVDANGASAPRLPQVAAPQDPLVAALQAHLYHHSYSRRFHGAVNDPQSGDAAKDLTADLAQANATQERWETGWQITQTLPSGQIAVRRNGLSRALWPGEYLATDAVLGLPRKGAMVSIFCPRHSTTIQPGFYFGYGETLPDQQDELKPVRFYWNVKATGVVTLARGLTRALNRFQIPFRFKCLINAAHYDRSDATVLYIARRFYPISAELLADVHQSVVPFLRADPPLFAKPLGVGLGLAEDPGNGESFGSHRCRVVAEALCASHGRGQSTPAERLAAIEEQFKNLGLTLAAPYLSAGSSDVYAWPPGTIAFS